MNEALKAYYQAIEAGNREAVLSKLAGATRNRAPIIRWHEYDSLNPDAGRTHDYNKITKDLIGKDIHVEYFSIGENTETGYRTGCYREVNGKVLDVWLGTINYVIFENGDVIAPYSLTDIKIEVL